MTGTQLQRLIDSVRFTQRETARLLDINERSMRRYIASAEVPKVVELAVRQLIAIEKERQGK